jgi:hypothetical protein
VCNFFSCVSTGDGTPMYFDAKLRKKCLSGKLSSNPDSHTSIADYFGYKGKREDTLNKYEYNPITQEFKVDQINNNVDDSDKIEKALKKLDFKTIVPELIIHPIVHPLELNTTKVTKKDIELLKQWDSVRDSVLASVWASVGASVRDSVGASVRDSVWDSVWASVWAYTSSYFDLQEWKYIEHEKGKNPYQPCIDLWNKGLVPSFDGKTWRLHGKEGKILWEGVLK